MSVYFKLFESDGTTPVYIFPVVFSANYPHTGKKIIEYTNPRGKGSITLDGGSESWDLSIKGVLKANDYNALMTLVDAMEEDVELNVPYVLTITGGYSYNVKRLIPITYEENSLRTNYIEYTCVLRCLSW